MSEPAATEQTFESPPIIPTQSAQLQEPRLVVHHLNNSRSQRILWLLEELGIPYSITKYERTPKMVAPPELLKVHPLGKSPVITDGDLTVAESGAIIEYLIAKYGNGRFSPPDAGYIDNLYYNHYAEGSLMPLMVNKLIFGTIPDRTPLLVRPVARAICNGVISTMIEPQLKQNLDMIETHLAKNPEAFFAGGSEPSSADFLMLFPMEALFSRSSNEVGPTIRKYVDRVHARPAYQRALEKGELYLAAPGSCGMVSGD